MALSRFRRMLGRVIVLLVAALMLASCGWRGIANVPLPGGPGTGSNKMTIYVQMPDTLALNVNSRVRVAVVFVGRVRSIELKNWIATLTLDLPPDVKLPENSLAKIGQSSQLASIATIVRGGGIPNLEVIQTEVNNLLTGRADQIREFLNRLDTFTGELNKQRDDITRAIDSTNRLLAIVGQRTNTLDRVLTEF